MVTSVDAWSKSDREPPFPSGQSSGRWVCLMWNSMSAPSGPRLPRRRAGYSAWHPGLETLPARLPGEGVAVVVRQRQPGGGRLVHDHAGVPVELDGRGGDHRGEGPLDRERDLVRLGRPRRHQHQVARLEDGPDALSDDVPRDVLRTAEEPRVVRTRVRGQRLDPGARGERRGGLVEADVP